MLAAFFDLEDPSSSGLIQAETLPHPVIDTFVGSRGKKQLGQADTKPGWRIFDIVWRISGGSAGMQ